MLKRSSRFNISFSPSIVPSTPPSLPLQTRNIYLSPSKRPSFALQKLSFHHPKAKLSQPETYIFRKSKGTPFACRDAACRVNTLTTNTLQKSSHNRPSRSHPTNSPPCPFRALTRVKIATAETHNFNISISPLPKIHLAFHSIFRNFASG